MTSSAQAEAAEADAVRSVPGFVAAGPVRTPRMSVWARLGAAMLLVTVAVGCSETRQPSASEPPSASPKPKPRPTSVQNADPCSLLPKSQVTAYDLKRVGKDISETSRSCTWTSSKFSMMLLVRWDSQTLIDFTQAFPVPVEEDVRLGGANVVMGTSDVRPACAAVFFPERGTVVEVVVGDTPPSTAAAACERVKEIGTAAVQEVRDQGLLKVESTATPTPTS